MTDKMKIEIKAELLKDLIQTINSGEYKNSEMFRVFASQLFAYKNQLELFEQYNSENWDEMFEKIEAADALNK